MDPARLKAEGWTTMDIPGFSGVIGSLWIAGDDDNPIVGFFSDDSHSNTNLNTVHGGVMMTFADMALGWGVVRIGRVDFCATIQLNMHFVAAPKLGSFITCRPELIRRTNSVAFVRGVFMEGERVVANADGIWKVMERRQDP